MGINNLEEKRSPYKVLDLRLQKTNKEFFCNLNIIK